MLSMRRLFESRRYVVCLLTLFTCDLCYCMLEFVELVSYSTLHRGDGPCGRAIIMIGIYTMKALVLRHEVIVSVALPSFELKACIIE